MIGNLCVTEASHNRWAEQTSVLKEAAQFTKDEEGAVRGVWVNKITTKT
jgi:hypothetical protein